MGIKCIFLKVNGVGARLKRLNKYAHEEISNVCTKNCNKKRLKGEGKEIKSENFHFIFSNLKFLPRFLFFSFWRLNEHLRFRTIDGALFLKR